MKLDKSNEKIHLGGQRLRKLHAEELVRLCHSDVKKEFKSANDLLIINYAHVIMLYEQNLLKQDETKKILEILKELEREGIENKIKLDWYKGDLTTSLEAYIIKKSNIDIGGRINTGRSRSDTFATLEKMDIRKNLIEIYDKLVSLEENLLFISQKNIETVMPGYTHHSKQAQPITLGFFLLGNFDVFLREIERIEDLWKRLNKCPMGSAALATTGFNIDRWLIASMLGFDGIHEHAYDAISSKDLILEYLFILSSIASDLGRISESFLLWNSLEFGMIELNDAFTSFSSIMPQKKNAVSLEALRAFNTIITGKLINAFGLLKAEPWSYGRELVIMTDDYSDAGNRVIDMLMLFSGLLKTAKFNKKRMFELANEGFSTATELADVLVREYNIPFRAAHQVVGLIIKKAIDQGVYSSQINSQMVEQSIEECLGKSVFIEPAHVKNALNPSVNVSVRCIFGGTAPVEVDRMIKNRNEQVKQKHIFLNQKRTQLADIHHKLSMKVDQVITGEVSNA